MLLVTQFLLLSPTVDWAVTHVGPSSSSESNTRSDCVHEVFTSGYTGRALLGSLPRDQLATNAWISPGSSQLSGDTKGLFVGLPTTRIVSGGAEMTLDPTRTLRDRLVVDIGEQEVTYIEVPDATHDIFTASWHEPERTDTPKEVGNWVGRL
jgi:acetyl esterase/lipase